MPALDAFPIHKQIYQFSGAPILQIPLSWSMDMSMCGGLAGLLATADWHGGEIHSTNPRKLQSWGKSVGFS